MTRQLPLLAALLILGAATPVPAQLPASVDGTPVPSLAPMIKRVSPAVVNIATRGTIEPSGAPALGLGPLGVVPAWQRRGVGSALMHALLGAAEATDETVVCLLGSPRYYCRFGFRPAVEAGIAAPDPAWGGAFQVRTFGTGRVPSGTFRYAAPFDEL